MLTSMPIIYSLKLVFNIANGPEYLSGLGDKNMFHRELTCGDQVSIMG